MINKKILFFTACILMQGLNAFSQEPSVDIKAYQKKYKGDDVVYLKNNEAYEIEPDGEDLSIRDISNSEMLFLTEKSVFYADRQITYVNHVSSIQDIDAYTLVPKEKGGYKKVKVKEYKESSNISTDVFYDDMSSKSFIYPNHSVGAIGVLNYTEQVKDAHFLSKFYFAAGVPIESSEFTIRVHKNVDLKYIVRNPKDDIVFKETVDGNFKVYTWSRKNIEKLKAESEAKSIAYETPHVIVYIATYKGKTQTHKVLENTAGLFDFCYSLLNKGMEEPNGELRKTTDSLLVGVTDPKEKVNLVYNFVQDNIKYIAFEDGLGGFVPRKPSMVCNRKYGDCKDIASLICSMLNYAGVPAYHTWIGTNAIPYKFSEVPVMGVANHMIASVYLDHQWYFLDGTAKYLPYRYPSNFIQGKQAMIAINADSFLLVDVPVISSSVNMTKNTIYVKVSGDTISGKGKRTLEGLTHCDLSSTIYMRNDNKLDDFWKEYLQVGQNNCKLQNINVKGLKDRDSMAVFTYDYIVPKYVTQIENESYVNLNLLQIWSNTDVDIPNRTRDFIFDETKGNEVEVIFTIPEGYTVAKIPDNFKIDKGAYGFDFSYERKGNTIVYHQKYWFNTLTLDKKEFASWNEIVALVHKAYRQSIVLKSTAKK